MGAYAKEIWNENVPTQKKFGTDRTQIIMIIMIDTD
jgi:hypothetical protein